MWIVQFALRRPYTFVIMSLLIVILGVLAIYRMPTDIFPEIDIPVVSVIWTYGGVSPEEMADSHHRPLASALSPPRSTTSSTSSRNRSPASASSASSSTPKPASTPPSPSSPPPRSPSSNPCPPASRRRISSATTPPACPSCNSASRATPCPSSSSTISATTSSAPSSSNVQGASFPLPYGGRPRQISVDLDPRALYAQGLSATDVVTAINNQSLILPSGSVKIGAQRIHRPPQ